MIQTIKYIEELSNKKFIVFAGTGVERSAGVSGWSDLIKDLLRTLPKYNGKSDKEINDIIESNKPWDLAQEVYDCLDQKQDYHHIIADKIRPTESDYSVQQLEIFFTTKWVITTNFGNTFENAFKRLCEFCNKNYKYKGDKLPNFDSKAFKNNKYVLSYLHGTTDEKFIIFRKDEYDHYYPNERGNNEYSTSIEDYLSDIYKEQTLVFVGVSFDDIYLKRLLKKIYTKYLKNDTINSIGNPKYKPILPTIKHYAFLKNYNSDDKYQMLKDELVGLKIMPIEYDDNKEWISCFEHIREMRNTQRRKKVKLKGGRSNA